jgi:hypothetical protein
MRSFKFLKLIVKLMQDIRNKIVEFRDVKRTRGT